MPTEQAPVSGGSHAARHADGARSRRWRRYWHWHGRRRVSLRFGGEEQLACAGWADQAPVSGGAHAARHADGARVRRRRRYWHRVGGAEQVACAGRAEQPVPRRGVREGARWREWCGGVFAGAGRAPGVATTLPEVHLHLCHLAICLTDSVAAHPRTQVVMASSRVFFFGGD
jgi:hypothetical protein